MLLIIVFGILGMSAYTVFFIRSVAHDPEVWHVDPRDAPNSETPNDFRLIQSNLTKFRVDMEAPTYAVDAATLSQAFDRFVMGQPRVERVAGSTQAGWVTYVQRSEYLQFPDYISVQFYNLGDTGTSTIAIYSRSRFGYSDMGVNKARVERWVKSIESFVQDEPIAATPAASE
ncbi:DUF1499 domain-containing protein [Halovulum sp. GXIMD14793]